ncbi:hypothetical protein ACFQ71_38230, partial [Streptomyces sp. NPDC056534]|uniref:hypothetical protein n=1 Tax=Streptomyces sp. NPDC056534 TaxID=3345857 RepID=UPI00369A5E1B
CIRRRWLLPQLRSRSVKERRSPPGVTAEEAQGKASDLSFLHSFTNGLKRGRTAIEAAATHR